MRSVLRVRPTCVRCSLEAPVTLDPSDSLATLPLFAAGWSLRARRHGSDWVCDGCDAQVPHAIVRLRAA